MNLPESSRTKCKDTPSLETSFADKTSLSRSTQNDENLPDWPDRELHSTRYRLQRLLWAGASFCKAVCNGK